jgi:hypothetical protein
VLDLVLVCPSMPLGPGDIGPTPTGKTLVDTLNGKIRFSFSGGLNIVDVEDVARGHLLAEARGRRGEAYLLSGHNMTIPEMIGELRRVVGLRHRTWPIPGGLAAMSARLSSIYADQVSQREPMITAGAVAYASQKLFYDNRKAREELGFTVRPLAETLRRAVEWFAMHGYIERAALPAIRPTARPRLLGAEARAQGRVVGAAPAVVALAAEHVRRAGRCCPPVAAVAAAGGRWRGARCRTRTSSPRAELGGDAQHPAAGLERVSGGESGVSLRSPPRTMSASGNSAADASTISRARVASARRRSGSSSFFDLKWAANTIRRWPSASRWTSRNSRANHVWPPLGSSIGSSAWRRTSSDGKRDSTATSTDAAKPSLAEDRRRVGVAEPLAAARRGRSGSRPPAACTTSASNARDRLAISSAR